MIEFDTVDDHDTQLMTAPSGAVCRSIARDPVAGAIPVNGGMQTKT